MKSLLPNDPAISTAVAAITILFAPMSTFPLILYIVDAVLSVITPLTGVGKSVNVETSTLKTFSILSNLVLVSPINVSISGCVFAPLPCITVWSMIAILTEKVIINERETMKKKN